MLLKLLFKQQAERKEARTRMLTELDRCRTIDRPENPGTQSKIFKMVDPLRHCSGAEELDKFLETLRSHFASHKHLFPRGDSDQVKYAVSFLDTWNKHPDTSQRQTEDTDPSEWASDLRDAEDQCSENFELFANVLQKMYGDKDRRLNSATKAMHEYQQLPNKSVRIYANRLNANWRRAGWSLITHKVVLYDMAWAGLRHALKTKVRPWISIGKDRFETLNQLFDCAAISEFKPDDKKPGGQQQQQRQAGESQKGGDKKHSFRPSISEPAEIPSGNSNNSSTGNSKLGNSNKSSGGSRANLSPAPWLSKEAYESRKANRQCTRCGSGDHKTYLCTKYGKTTPPEQNSSNSGGGYDCKQIKRQKSFNMQQQKNESTSLDI